MEEIEIYTAKKPLHHDGKDVRPGHTVQLTHEQAKPLLELDAISLGKPESKTAASVVLGEATLGKMTLDELKAYAAAHNVGHASEATKAEIVAAILAPKA